MKKAEKDNKSLLFENMEKLNPDFKNSIEENRLVTQASSIHSEISKLPNLNRIDLWSTASGFVGLYRYEVDGNAYEIEIRPIQTGKYKDMWGDKIKKREDR